MEYMDGNIVSISGWGLGGKAHAEHKTSGLRPIATDAGTSSIGGFVPSPDSRHR
jgi:hypothetical protein